MKNFLIKKKEKQLEPQKKERRKGRRDDYSLESSSY